ncbi:MAG: NTP transferase domain-containing protein [bacterium]|nr:NTP transferase domain-containing protein [bacterium]
MNIGIILAAGRGSRMNSTTKNKTSMAVAGKPLVQYGVDLYAKSLDKTVVVVGAFADSVKEALKDNEVVYAHQTEQKGTGHAVRVAIDTIKQLGIKPDQVVVGYGDHMMYYPQSMITALLAHHTVQQAAITLVTTNHEDPITLAWGRIIRNAVGLVAEIVEQKEATPDELKVTELNAGFYCFEYDFLAKEITKLQPAAVAQEYYLTDLIGVANQQGRKVVPMVVEFSMVGSGINTLEQLQATDVDLLSKTLDSSALIS